MGQILPDSLEYLDLDLAIDPNDLKTFLDNCKQVELNKLLVKNQNMKSTDVTFNVLKKFIRERRINQFAYQVDCKFDPNNLKYCNLEKLVNDSKVDYYHDLVVRI